MTVYLFNFLEGNLLAGVCNRLLKDFLTLHLRVSVIYLLTSYVLLFCVFLPHRDCKALPLWKPRGCPRVPAVHSGCYAKVLLTWNQVSFINFQNHAQLRITHNRMFT